MRSATRSRRTATTATDPTDDAPARSPPTSCPVAIGAVVAARRWRPVAAFGSTQHRHRRPWQLALLLVMMPVSERALLHVRVGGQQYSFTWGEAALLVGFVLVSPGAGSSWPPDRWCSRVHLAVPAGRAQGGVQRRLLHGWAGATGLARPSAGGRRRTSCHGTWRRGADRGGHRLQHHERRCSPPACVGLATHRTGRASLDSVRMSVVVWAGNISCALGILTFAERSAATLWRCRPC